MFRVSQDHSNFWSGERLNMEGRDLKRGPPETQIGLMCEGFVGFLYISDSETQCLDGRG